MLRARVGKAVVAGCALAALLVMTVVLPVAETRGQQAPKVYTQLECPLGCGVVEGYTVAASFVAKEHPWLVLRPQETPGYMYNIREMAQNKARWKDTCFGTEDTIIQLAAQGGSPILKEFVPEPIPIKWKLLYGWVMATQGMWYITLDPNLKTIADLKGKRIGLGLRSQSDWGMDARLFLEVAYGVTTKNSDIRHLGPVKASEAMLDGKVDAAVMGMMTDPEGKNWLAAAPMRLLEASGRTLHYIGIDKDAVHKVNTRFGTTYQAIAVPKGTLKDQAAAFTIGIDRAYAACHPEFDEGMAYEAVKTLSKLQPRLAKLHPLWKFLTPELMVNGLTEENAHPGAIRAYKELGYWDLRTKYPPVTYPSK